MDNQKGFTLIELLSILIVMGILLAIVVPEIKTTREKWILDSTAREIAEDIRWAQHLAITECMNHNFDLDTANRSYRIRSILSNKPTVKSVNINSSITNISSTFKKEGNYHRLSFAPNGNPAQVGSIYLTSKSGKSLTITVVVSTGRVVIKK